MFGYRCGQTVACNSLDHYCLSWWRVIAYVSESPKWDRFPMMCAGGRESYKPCEWCGEGVLVDVEVIAMMKVNKVLNYMHASSVLQVTVRAGD